MRRLRPALAVTATLTLTAAAVPALGSPAATTTTPATGAAQSTLTLLDLSLANHTAALGSIAAVATTTNSRVAQLVVTPAQLDGKAYGQQTVTPSSAPATVDGSAKSISIPNVLDATGPTFAVDAQSGPTAVLTSAVLKALGQVTLKPAGLVSFPLDLTAATLDNVAKVTSTDAEASKSVVIGNLSLPSVNTLLGSLGVNVPALLQQLTQQALTTLGTLVGEQGLTALNSAVDAAQANVQNAADTLAGATAALAPAQKTVTDATTAFNQAKTAADGAVAAFSTAMGTIPGATLTLAGVTSALTAQQFLALPAATQTLLDAATSSDLAALAQSVVSTASAETLAQTALSAAQDVLAKVQALIDALQALVNGVLGAVTGNSNPLATLGNVTVKTSAIATTTSTPTPVAEASVGTLKILGSDSVPAQLSSAVGGVLTTLTGVLNSVTGVKFSPPTVAIGTGKTGTATSGTTRQATASITGVTITLPTLELPTQLSTVTSAIPGFATVANGVTSVLGGKVDIATLAETAAMTPERTTSTPDNPSTPTTTHNPSTPSNPTTPSTPSLAKTGLTTALPLTAALLILAALAVAHRRRSAAELDS